jgi:hypothetical protein
MHAQTVPIDGETLRHLYSDERLSMVEVAALLGCGASTVRRALIRLAITSRRRGPQPSVHLHAPTPRAWTAELAYAVGLMASDGNLGRVHGRLALCSNDTEMLENARRCLDIRAPVRPYANGCHHIQWTDHALYSWLLEVGLSPAKSLTIGPLRVPEEYFRASSAGASTAPARSWCTPTDITPRRTRDTFTSASTSCSCRRALRSSTGFAPLLSVSSASAALSRLNQEKVAVRSAGSVMPRENRCECSAGSITRRASCV